MKDFYPEGAYFDPRAPYNEIDEDENGAEREDYEEGLRSEWADAQRERYMEWG